MNSRIKFIELCFYTDGLNDWKWIFPLKLFRNISCDPFSCLTLSGYSQFNEWFVNIEKLHVEYDRREGILNSNFEFVLVICN